MKRVNVGESRLELGSRSPYKRCKSELEGSASWKEWTVDRDSSASIVSVNIQRTSLITRREGKQAESNESNEPRNINCQQVNYKRFKRKRN